MNVFFYFSATINITLEMMKFVFPVTSGKWERMGTQISLFFYY